MEDENFKKELEDFFKLFKRFVERDTFDGMPGVDPQQLEQLKQFMSQFDDVKDKLNIDQIHVDPFTKMMISAMVQQMREQLGPEAEEQEDVLSAEDIVNRREEELKALSDEKQREVSLIEAIDEQLRNPNLSDVEIDALLDKRSQISSKLSQV